MVHILFWNPDISSMTRERMRDEMVDLTEDGEAMDWSFWEYENVKPGDVCYLVRCGDATGPHGMMLRGHIISEAYQNEDWSGRGRKTMYADWYPMEFIDTENAAPLSPEELEKAMPDFDWRGGHSGRELPPVYEGILQGLWEAHLRGIMDDLGFDWFMNPHAPQLLDSTLDLWKTANAAEAD